jgi:glucose-6-phosphate 1-dehydrogenase
MSDNGLPRPDNHVVVLFGATGDLAKRKLLPGWFHLYAADLLPKKFRLIGSSPLGSALTDEQFREHARQSCADFCITKPDDPLWSEFAANLSFAAGQPDDTADLVAAVQRAEKEVGGTPRRLYHLAIPPVAFISIVRMLGDSGLATPLTRVIVEKPFGTDLNSARKLDQELHTVFDESQVFRIDHFLGKESVDNILAFRFANGLFEPVWNREHIQYVQIDVPETLSIEGRGAFYDATGAYRDMIVTHLFQVLGFVAMEPPTSLDAGPLRAEKLKVYEALKPIDVRHVVRGQYEGYRSEPGVAPDSDTETMVAARAEVENWRWQGVPFFLRSGKLMGASRQVVTLGFHEPPLRMFPAHRRDVPTGRVNEIIIDFADPGSITTDFLAKIPGPELALGRAMMTFRYEDSFAMSHALEGYERLILLAMTGDQALFTSSAGIERLWEISEPLLEDPPPVELYAKGSWGPPSVDKLIAPFHWHLPGPDGAGRVGT